MIKFSNIQRDILYYNKDKYILLKLKSLFTDINEINLIILSRL